MGLFCARHFETRGLNKMMFVSRIVAEGDMICHIHMNRIRKYQKAVRFTQKD